MNYISIRVRTREIIINRKPLINEIQTTRHGHMPAVMAFLLPIILAAGQWMKIQTPLNWNFNLEKN